MRGWRNTVGSLIEICWLKNNYGWPQFTGICVNNRGIRFNRMQDFKQYYFNSIQSHNHILLKLNSLALSSYAQMTLEQRAGAAWGQRRDTLRSRRGDAGVCEKPIPPENNLIRNIGFWSTKSGAGKQFLERDC